MSVHSGIIGGLPSSKLFSFPLQVAACVKRQYQIIWGDKATFFIKQTTNIIQALIAGSLFYNAPGNTAGLLSKSGTLFFSLLYPTLVAMSEVTDSFNGRPVLVKQKSFAFFHPAAFCIAQIAADIPVLLFQTSTFALILYFMVDLDRSAGAFFTYWAIILSTAFCMTALFRAIGALFKSFDAASKVSGIVVTALFLYTGFQLQKPQMHPWFVWLFWIDPLAYAFDALLSNEFHGKIVNCVGNNLIPSGPDYMNSTQSACSGIGGGRPGKSFVLGDDYLASLSYSHSHLWRNFGIIWAWWVLFVAVTVWATSRWKSPSENGPSLVIPRENSKYVAINPQGDVETQNQTSKEVSTTQAETPSGTEEEGSDSLQAKLIRNTSIFTWKNLSYTVKTPSGDRLLLDNVQGWIKPGNLTALMGSSGAGKTTLLDVLAQRKTDGTISGSVLVDGRPLPVSFQRSAGYCEQLDVHEPYATVREALEFSALLRQSRETPRAEKLAYVDTIIDLLELKPLADTLIGEVGAGLTVEQRKRVTIGVELVSKPSILIFLDEPTSGLDGQSAYRTVKFLRKLAAVGQAVLVTIHQPSAQLFSQFDSLLLLAKGGKTVYFGDIGEHGQTIKDYFGRNGCPCPPDANPAEYMIDVVSGNNNDGRDWNQVWLASPEHEKMTAELDSIIADAAAKPPGTVDDGHEFATPMGEQIRVVTQRMNVSLWRNTEYVNNKVMLHIFSALFNGFSFWMVGNSFGDLQAKMFAIFQFIFVAPGVLAQLQPLFISRRDIFETREKKSKTYSWFAFTTGLIISEMPYLVVCGVIYYLCWYYTVGFPGASTRAGGTFYVMLMYEFLYTGIGQFIAAYAPNVVSATLVNPLIIGVLVSFCGVLVPYAQIQPFWRYWMYYLDPFNYLMGSILTFTMWGNDVKCKEREFARFDPPSGQTCSQYLDTYLHSPGPGSVANLVNPSATSDCKVCTYTKADDYLRSLNLNEYYYGWRDAGIVTLLVFSSYILVACSQRLPQPDMTLDATTDRLDLNMHNMPPTIHLIRHAEGTHNLSFDNHVLHDPSLTDRGKEQAQELGARIAKLEADTGAKIDLVMASALRRTLMTALIAFESQPTQKQPGKIYAWPEVQEVSDLPCDSGSSLALVRAEFGTERVNYDLVHNGWELKEAKYINTERAVAARAQAARQWLKEQPYKDIAVVSHGCFLHFLTEDWEGSDSPQVTDDEFALIETSESRERRGYPALLPSREEQKRLREATLGVWAEWRILKEETTR
ncbi:hypothetical protein NLG97_g4053 [Lecanicillium saksenae]|uniref:Uncharacterized protein n=1 Tax=Lecanicillium saksenae TaxID=468837 RepID=A0ACC1QWY1_9HYPO|nr:hypothetical protein NLG97_g4053 [Lecanicillium saksenae]